MDSEQERIMLQLRLDELRKASDRARRHIHFLTELRTHHQSLATIRDAQMTAIDFDTPLPNATEKMLPIIEAMEAACHQYANELRSLVRAGELI